METRLVKVERDLLMIPSLAIHMDRAVNEGRAINKQVDMLPVFAGSAKEPGEMKKLIAEEIGVEEEKIYGMDLFLYNRMEPSVWGRENEFLSCPQLDDLQCAFASLNGFLAGENAKNINVFACFDNEEVGSGTKQGAASTLLSDVLWRINKALGKDEEDFYRAVAGSFMLSCDNAHAVHPNYQQKTDVNNCNYMNEGIVIKSHAGQKYTSDAVSIAIFKAICEKAGVPVQVFANLSEAAGGSTLGNICLLYTSIENLPAAIVINQKKPSPNQRSTVGTYTDTYTLLRLLFSRVGQPFVGYSDSFSFNHPQGCCLRCNGLGEVTDLDVHKLVDFDKCLNDDGVIHLSLIHI